jgi:hypothetical protein
VGASLGVIGYHLASTRTPVRSPTRIGSMNSVPAPSPIAPHISMVLWRRPASNVASMVQSFGAQCVAFTPERFLCPSRTLWRWAPSAHLAPCAAAWNGPRGEGERGRVAVQGVRQMRQEAHSPRRQRRRQPCLTKAAGHTRSSAEVKLLRALADRALPDDVVENGGAPVEVRPFLFLEKSPLLSPVAILRKRKKLDPFLFDSVNEFQRDNNFNVLPTTGRQQHLEHRQQHLRRLPRRPRHRRLRCGVGECHYESQ